MSTHRNTDENDVDTLVLSTRVTSVAHSRFHSISTDHSHLDHRRRSHCIVTQPPPCALDLDSSNENGYWPTRLNRQQSWWRCFLVDSALTCRVPLESMKYGDTRCSCWIVALVVQILPKIWRTILFIIPEPMHGLLLLSLDFVLHWTEQVHYTCLFVDLLEFELLNHASAPSLRDWCANKSHRKLPVSLCVIINH